MVDIWLDAVTPKDSLLISSLLPPLLKKGYKTIVTAKRQTQTTDVLELLNIKYTCVGKYGQNLEKKLVEEQKRTLELVKLFNAIGYPKVLWTHGDVSAIRTAFGLQIPTVYSNDTPHAIHVAKLVCPLVNWLLAPSPFGKSWSRFGIPRSRIVLYDGIEEVAYMRISKGKDPKLLRELIQKGRLVLFRNAEYKASYFRDVKVDVWRLVEELSKLCTVVYLPRYEEERVKLRDQRNVWVPPKPVLAFQLIPIVDLVVGSGGTICREAALMGVPTINFHFWDAVARYIHKKGFPMKYVTNTDKIINVSRRILTEPRKHRMDTMQMLEKLESPTPMAAHYIESFL